MGELWWLLETLTRQFFPIGTFSTPRVTQGDQQDHAENDENDDDDNDIESEKSLQGDSFLLGLFQHKKSHKVMGWDGPGQ